MKKGINCWCFPSGFSLVECMEIAYKAGFDGIEINMKEESNKSLDLVLNSSEKELLGIKKIADEMNLEIPSISTSLFWKYCLTSSDKDIREKGKMILREMLRAASIVGADTILVVPGVVNEKTSYLEAYSRALKVLKGIKDMAEELQVKIGIENVWNKFLLSPLEMKRFIDEIDSSYVGAYFDVGNVVDFSYPEYWIEILGERIFKVHVKDFKCSIGNVQGFTNLLEGDVNWLSVIEYLKEAGYNDYLTAELSPYKSFPRKLAEDTASSLEYIIKRKSNS